MFGQQDDTQTQGQDDLAIPEQAVTEPADAAPQSDDQQWQHPGVPLDGALPQAPTSSPDPSVVPSGPAESVLSSPNELLDIKQQALTQLSPLVGHLDQSPEEKFRTTMMMIQASDNQSLIKSAFEAAQAIDDEKTRAQALLDIVNEINYFTQHVPQA